jgi:hypothetical protein
MDFKLALARAWAIVTLNKEAAREVAADENALVPALVITAIGGFLGSLITMNPAAWIATLVLALVGLAVGTAILHLLALLFGGQGSWTGLFKALGHGSGLVSWAGIVPIIGGLIGLWSIPVAVISVEELYGLGRGKAIAVVLIPVVFLMTLACVGVAVLGGSIVAMLMHRGG